jgi:hypothetical protein
METIKVADLYTSVVLRYFKIPITGISVDNSSRAIFEFCDSNQVSKVLDDYRLGRLQVEPAQFIDLLRSTKALMFDVLDRRK